MDINANQNLSDFNDNRTQNPIDYSNSIDKIPNSISNGAILIYISLGVGLLNSILLEMTTNLKILSNPENLFVAILTIVLLGFFGYKIHQGKKWARTTFLVLFIIGLVAYPSYLIQLFNLNLILSDIISLIQTGLQIFALTLLFSKDSKTFYNNMKRLKTN